MKNATLLLSILAILLCEMAAAFFTMGALFIVHPTHYENGQAITNTAIIFLEITSCVIPLLLALLIAYFQCKHFLRNHRVSSESVYGGALFIALILVSGVITFPLSSFPLLGAPGGSGKDAAAFLIILYFLSLLVSAAISAGIAFPATVVFKVSSRILGRSISAHAALISGMFVSLFSCSIFLLFVVSGAFVQGIACGVLVLLFLSLIVQLFIPGYTANYSFKRTGAGRLR